MEKKIARVIRWLDRCSRACSAGSWRNALMDMECAKAELDEARQDLWTLAEGTDGHPSLQRAVKVLGVACTALLLLLVAAIPLASPPMAQNSVVVVESVPSLEWVSADEKTVLLSLRKSLSEANFGVSPEESGEMVTAGHPIVPSRDRRAVERTQPSGGSLERNREDTSPGRHDVDSILFLVQVGRKALEGEESPIRYIRESP